MNYKQQALLLMEFQQDAFAQESGFQLPHAMCKRKVLDFLMRKYKMTAKKQSPERDFELTDCENLFWAVIQLEGGCDE
jgi:hypothetical protein